MKVRMQYVFAGFSFLALATIFTFLQIYPATVLFGVLAVWMGQDANLEETKELIRGLK